MHPDAEIAARLSHGAVALAATPHATFAAATTHHPSPTLGYVVMVLAVLVAAFLAWKLSSDDGP